MNGDEVCSSLHTACMVSYFHFPVSIESPFFELNYFLGMGNLQAK